MKMSQSLCFVISAVFRIIYSHPHRTRRSLRPVPLADARLPSKGGAASFDIKGLSLGSNGMPAVRPVRIGLLSGDGVDATSFGFLWSLFSSY